MNSSELSPENVSSLIERVLEAKDPSAVGLKRILRRKEEESNDYPLRGAVLEEFAVPGREPVKFSQDERRVLELEKTVADLRIALKRQHEAAIDAVRESLTKGKTEGFAQGRAEGVAVTAAAYEKKIDALQQRITEFLQSLETAKRSIFSNAEHLLLKLCCAMVRKVIDREVSLHHDIVLGVLKKALTYIGHHERMVVRVAPDDLELVAQRKDFWFPVAQRLKDITIEADARIQRGGCIVESNAGVVDARLGVQLEEIAGIIEKTWIEVASATGGEGDPAIEPPGSRPR
jgi:flagellar biosynthesis/type III secretory pathway protein FliH